MANRGARKEFAVIGLGRFGVSLALTLMQEGYAVLGIDLSPALVQHYADELTQTVALDATDDDALRAANITEFETVVVAIGSNFESNLMATVILKGMGVKKVVCKALTRRQEEILRRVGADEVVLPEEEAGRQLALRLSATNIIDFIPLQAGYSVAETAAPGWLVGKTLVQAALPDTYGLTVLVIKRGEKLILPPRLDDAFQPADLLVLVGSDDGIRRFIESA